MLKARKLFEDVILPIKAHHGDAGFDVFSREDVTIPSLGGHVFSLGFSVEIDPGSAGIISERSGMASKSGALTIGNVIDSGYRGEVHAIMRNLGSLPIEIKKGQKIAQLLIVRCDTDSTVKEFPFLPSSERNDDHFGSSGE